MAKYPQPDDVFQVLLARIQQETDSPLEKLQILYSSKGYFDATQASQILHALSRPEDKIRAIRMLESRLCRMTCRDGRDILTAFNIHNDRLIALDTLKRVLMDYLTVVGEEYILTTFPFEGDKKMAKDILGTVRSDIEDRMGSGGFQTYGSLGMLVSQARPMDPHMYGSLPHQARSMPGKGRVEAPPYARVGVVPSIYTGHPSYAYPVDKSYGQEKGYPGTVGFPAKEHGPRHYPGGAPALGNHSGAMYPTGFPNLDARGFAY
ncbi:uncharacterized protein LOC143285904 [Babylonia areolata]|uniref:uncharacterized protein LOC143285904 n=1 Tax=Babylonia areolata TaxID=304850 RepID=UPI003FCF344B